MTNKREVKTMNNDIIRILAASLLIYILLAVFNIELIVVLDNFFVVFAFVSVIVLLAHNKSANKRGRGRR